MSEKDMTEKVNEQISALVDGELGSEEQEFLLRRLVQDQELQRKWNRYHLISDALQNHLPSKMDAGLAALVSNELEKEDGFQEDGQFSELQRSELQGSSSQKKGWVKSGMKSVAGLSIAASVAVISIVGIQQYNASQTNNGVEPVTISSAFSSTSSPVTFEKKLAAVTGSDVSPVYIRVSGTRWNLDRPGIGSRLNSYLVNHNEYVSTTNLQGMVHYARIAGYDTKK